MKSNVLNSSKTFDCHSVCLRAFSVTGSDGRMCGATGEFSCFIFLSVLFFHSFVRSFVRVLCIFAIWFG